MENDIPIFLGKINITSWIIIEPDPHQEDGWFDSDTCPLRNDVGFCGGLNLPNTPNASIAEVQCNEENCPLLKGITIIVKPRPRRSE